MLLAYQSKPSFSCHPLPCGPCRLAGTASVGSDCQRIEALAVGASSARSCPPEHSHSSKIPTPKIVPTLQDWGVSTYLNRHRRDPFVSSVCFEADSPQARAQWEGLTVVACLLARGWGMDTRGVPSLHG